MADTYLGVLVDQVLDARIRRGQSADAVGKLIGPVNTARRQASAAYTQWTDLLASPRGRMATWLGLVSQPSLGMAVYERKHPR